MSEVKMNFACEAEIGVQNEHALRFSIISKPTPMLEYIKTISSLVGATHILAVFDEGDSIKVFFDDKRFVDSLIRSGIHVLGHHIRVDYVVPPGVKVVLSNVDPVISNFDLIRLLSVYGTIVSPIIRPPISDDTEFCHIGYGVRYVYMALNGSMPNKLEFKYGDQLCIIKVKINDDSSFLFIKPDDLDLSDEEVRYQMLYDAELATVDTYTIEANTNVDPVVVSVESCSSESNSDEQIDASKSSMTEKSPVKRRGRMPKTLHVKRAKITATSRAAKKIRQNIKHTWIRKRKPFKRGRRGKKVKQEKKHHSSPPPILPSLSPCSSDNALTPPLLIPNSTADKGSFSSILSEEKLQTFIDECKHQRAPLEVAKKYLGNDSNNDLLKCLIMQLNEYRLNHSIPYMKLRIARLIKSLTDTM